MLVVIGEVITEVQQLRFERQTKNCAEWKGLKESKDKVKQEAYKMKFLVDLEKSTCSKLKKSKFNVEKEEDTVSKSMLTVAQLKAHYSQDMTAVNNHIQRCKEMTADGCTDYVAFDAWSNQETYALLEHKQKSG
eukprot:4469332-Amphidinium_carterae.1